VHVDSTAPTVTLTDPGSISGTTSLTANVSGPAAANVVFQVSPTGANTWQTVATDTASPWSTSFDSTSVGDGVYDLRAVATDSLGNVGTSPVVTDRIDNHAPTIASSTPADGSVVTSATSISLDLSELATLTNVTLDGTGTVAPTITGTHVAFATGALTSGEHTLALTLTDGAGKTADAQVHFTVYQQGDPMPSVEANASSTTSSTTVTAPDGSYSVTVPPNDWPTGVNPSSWMIVRLAPTVPASVPAAPSNMQMKYVVEIIARWADGSGQLHQFNTPLDIAFTNGAGVVPATAENGAWRLIKQVPSAGALPVGWTDGYYRDGNVVHVLTRHLSLFALVVSSEPPGAPASFAGTVNGGDLYLRWGAAADNGSPVANYVVYVDGVSTASLGGSEYQYDVGPYDPADNRGFSVVAVDQNGDDSAPTPTLKVVPTLAGLSLDQARSALAAKGFSAGDVTVVDSTQPEGTVVGPTDVVLAEVGASVPLQVSAGPGGGNATKFVFSVVTTKRLPLSQRTFIGVHLAATRSSTITAALVNAQGKIAQTWRMQGKAGVATLRLRLGKQVRGRPGRYVLRWTAISGADVIRQTRVVWIVRTKQAATKLVPRQAPVDVVVAGASLPKQLPMPSKTAQRIVSSTESAFSVTGDPSTNVQVIVVDVDEFGIGLLRDLRTVFPGVRLIALSDDPRKLAPAVRAGATIALPKGTPTVKLAKVVSALAGGVRLPQAAQRR
jgi:hypothetical protein